MIEYNKIYHGNSLAVLRSFPDETFDCIVTSPPYWALRNYQTDGQVWDGDVNCEHNWEIIDILRKATPGDIPAQSSKVALNRTNNENRPGKPSEFCLKCGAWRGELGLEPTFELYIKHLCDIFDECRRVLKKTGTCFVNIGDTYASGTRDYAFDETRENLSKEGKYCGGWHEQPNRKLKNYPSKSLCCIPDRFKIEMINRGWICRNELIWHKNNCMPSSANDRFTVDFEKVYFFVKNQRYFFEQQFEKYTHPLDRWGGVYTDGNVKDSKYLDSKIDPGQIQKRPRNFRPNEQGRNKRCVWSINTKPYKEAHFATYPEKLIEPMVAAGCPEFICNKCGAARQKIYKTETEINSWGKANKIESSAGALEGRCGDVLIKEVALSDCGCNAGFHGGLVLDPFMGAGTTAIVSMKQNKNYVGIELNEKYIVMAKNRIAKTFPNELKL